MHRIAEMFGDLAELDVDSPEYRLLQHRIIEDCLRIADNIARLSVPVKLRGGDSSPSRINLCGE